MDIKLAVTAFAIHVVFFASIFDIYFTSPLVHGMTPQWTDLPPPATRLVLFVADGLRADKLYSLDEEGRSRAPYLRRVIETTGSWGISHTRVPTESRPGHVALIAGFYEDVSAVAKGWKENPVEFDSVFNESHFTWSWGSPDILPMFAKGATGDHVFTHSYGAEEEDFAEADASKSDTWVFDRVTEFFGNSTRDGSLASKLQEDKIVFFLHLLGIDTNGHSHKPYSSEYLENIRLVDEGVERMVQLVEDYYHRDGKTAYILTADHGMTDWGSHGAGHPDETLTPVVAWGAGIKGPRSPGVNDHQDSFSQDWGLAHLRRVDMNQADIAPLMTSLIGTPYPLNSVGLLPLEYLNNTPEFRAESLFTNMRQIMAQYLVKEHHMQVTTLPVFFRLFKPLMEAERSRLTADIQQLLKDGSFQESITKSEEAIRMALDGLNYYQTYDRLFLGTSVTLSYLGWMGCLLFQLIHHHTDLSPRSHGDRHSTVRPNIRVVFAVVGMVVAGLLFLQSSPMMYYVYCLLPVLLWHSVFQRYRTFTDAYMSIRRDYGLTVILSTTCLCIAGVEILVLSLFYREVVSLGLVAIATWPLMSSSMRKNHLVLALGWLCSCLILSLFPLLPVVGRDTNTPLVVAAGLCILLAGTICLKLLPKNGQSRVFPAQLIAVVVATLVVYSTWSSIHRGAGLPLVNQVISWCMLVASFFVPSLVPTGMLPRLLSIGLSFSSAYILLSTSHEGFFCLVLCIVMLFWLLCEQKSSRTARNLKLLDVSFSDAVSLDRGPSRKLELVDLRCAFFFVFFILTAFFGTGNIASINSFDPSAVYCFLTVFNPFVMGTLLLWKVAILLILVSCTFQAIHVVLRVPTAGLFLVVLLMSDCMALQFFFLVRDSGSWLEIGTSISHYVIVMSMILFLNLLLVLAKFFTMFSFRVMRGKAHHL